MAVINVDSTEPNIFDDSDVKTLETLADQLAVAMENINLLLQQQDQSQRLAVADERDRIGRDLHDGVIQSMYAVGLNLEDSVIELIAKRVQKNVRELEGSLNRMVAYSQLMNVAINLESTSNILDAVISDTARHTIEPERIIEEVGDYYRVSTEALLGRSRTKRIAQARQVTMYLLSYELEMSPTQIGRILGGRDHATVIHGAGKINGEINEDSQLRQDVLTIKEAIFTVKAA